MLATEMLEALGVNTSKSFSLFETGDARAQRRAIAHALVGTRSTEPLPHSLRHFSEACVHRRIGGSMSF